MTWQAILKEIQVKLDLLAGIDMLLMVEKGDRGGICNAVHHFGKANNIDMEDYHENKKSLYL